MAIRNYRLRGVLREVPGDQINTSDVGIVSAVVFAKRANLAPPPYDVVNEYVCGELAKLIRLPVPPSFIGRRIRDPQPYFCSPSFNLSGENPAPANCALVAAQDADAATGVLLYDIWIANTDRHDENISFRRYGAARRLNVFDHSHALFREAGSLELHAGKLGITKERDEHNRHCLLDHIATDIYFPKWIGRIQGVSDEVLAEILEEAVELGLPPQLSARGLEFLRMRRDTLPGLVSAHRHEFSGIAQWSLEWST